MQSLGNHDAIKRVRMIRVLGQRSKRQCVVNADWQFGHSCLMKR